jgi:hypothetical protein
MNTIFQALIPYDSPQLQKQRLGQKNDGGYVIPMNVVSDIEAVVVFGVNDDDSFEKDLANYLDPKKIPFYLCDPFVPYTKTSEFHFESLGLAAETKDKMIAWRDVRKRFGLEGKKILLKIDIEGAEWESLANLVTSDLDGVVCLLIEFHHLIRLQDLDNQQKVLTLLNKIFTVVHLHANNCGYCFANEKILFPDVLECTYVSTNYLDSHGIQRSIRQIPYPSEIDQPNTLERPEYPIFWWLT